MLSKVFLSLTLHERNKLALDFLGYISRAAARLFVAQRVKKSRLDTLEENPKASVSRCQPNLEYDDNVGGIWLFEGKGLAGSSVLARSRIVLELPAAFRMHWIIGFPYFSAW